MTDQSAPALKEIFNLERLQHIATEMTAVYPAFDAKGFLEHANAGLAELSVMQRMARVSESLHAVIPLDYPHTLKRLYALAPRLNSGFVSLFLPQYVASYGRDDFKRSMAALKYFTTFGSSEFGIRRFLLDDFERTLAVMQTWSLDDNEHVRRLASEGSRPRLPWSFRLGPVQADPELCAPILDNLKADSSLYVRKSVANHLNDITKDHPDWVLSLLEGWSLDNPHTAWIARHALRGLIKQGNTRALAIMGAGARAEVKIHHLSVTPAVIRLGERINLSFSLESTAATAQKLVVDYAIDYVKSAGHSAAKVFKLKTMTLEAGEHCSLRREQHIRELTTRKHYPGKHAVHVLINGEKLASAEFELLKP
ncbi:DNA alkylation repair protein [Pseudomonas sp. BCA14]|uniref:DNA alkylation repair protein n=1 Tax=unclassified Pseudomonas TaxID=196821 RepID=UPI00106DE43D|nr:MULTISPECIES: DNA alkylation repair protein [unclassified Pseudomonas]TFF02955.1 DNA alkylation repair protein [Pseudomonas sp. JMN1]TFF04276.1 DNA alkylation repair protein [Pseudomonas sp. BCA17]TFF20068.1 DNA alkylation repair protein [Pseudomonas sp. BCA14]TFF20327.1 DNA alkylation repair protein [Pseudomonas sp. BCA13]